MNRDFRNLANGLEIPTEYYSDQPYILQTDDRAWLCVITTGAGLEGALGQHVVTSRSLDQGLTWSEPVDVEPADGPEASYAVLLKIPGGRIFCFYNHNTDNLRQAKADPGTFPGGFTTRVDSQGHFVFKYSDDGGCSWSAQRYDIPIRTTEIDRGNPYQGEIKYFWNVGRPFLQEAAAFVPLIKVGGFGHGFFTSSEGVLLKCANILTEADPGQFRWQLLPDGEHGLRTPPGGGPIAEEQSYSVLSDGSFYSVYRTIDGSPTCAYSRDGGHTWSAPQYQQYADGRPFRHPRAANFCWKCLNGKYLYWYHNHFGHWYDGRNPVWIAGGVEADSPEGRVIRWTQGEILLYDDDPQIRISYPDLLEENGRYFITETQKDHARVHEIPAGFLEKLWQQLDRREICQDDLLLGFRDPQGLAEWIDLPELPPLLGRDVKATDAHTIDFRAGFALDFWLERSSAIAGQTVFDNHDAEGAGICVRTTDTDAVEIILSDGQGISSWSSDPGSVPVGHHHLGIIVDGGPKIISFITDGSFNDGGGRRDYGFGRFNPWLRHVNGTPKARLGSDTVRVTSLRIYGRALMVTEMIGNWRITTSGTSQ